MDSTPNSSETAARIQSERVRLGLTVEQFAVLAGIQADEQKAIEAGQFDRATLYYYEAIGHFGVDLQFVHGLENSPQTTNVGLYFGDKDFNFAVKLLRRSYQAVEAFIGEGAAASCPQLVAATMNAAVHSKFAAVAYELDDYFDKLADSIEAAGTAIADAIAQASDADGS